MLEGAGYSVRNVVAGPGHGEEEQERLARTKEIRALARKVIIGGVLGATIIALMYIPLDKLGLTSLQLNLVLWVLASPVHLQHKHS